jgi:hypothetical protein
MDDLNKLRVLSGIKQPGTDSSNTGSNISITASQKAEIMRANNIKPGTDAWFKLWFSKPYLTSEKPF